MKQIHTQEIPLLKRKVLTFSVEHPKMATPSYKHLKEKLSENLKVDKEHFVISEIRTGNGQNNSVLKVNVYGSKDDFNKYESIANKKMDAKKMGLKVEEKKTEKKEEKKEEKK